MTPYLILGAVLGLPLVLGLLFRVSTSHIFFSLMAGELLSSYFGENIGNIVHNLSGNHLVADYARAGVILIPMILTALFLRKTVSKGMVAFHFIPLLITGIVFAAFLLPELPADAQAQIRSIEAGRQMINTSTAIIGGVIFLQLVSLWLLNRESGHERHKGHHKKHKHLG
jgi:hypothetical protein